MLFDHKYLSRVIVRCSNILYSILLFYTLYSCNHSHALYNLLSSVLHIRISILLMLQMHQRGTSLNLIYSFILFNKLRLPYGALSIYFIPLPFPYLVIIISSFVHCIPPVFNVVSIVKTFFFSLLLKRTQIWLSTVARHIRV